MEEFDVEQYQEQLARIFEAHDVVLAYLFGSQAAGAAGALSDVDVAVLLARTAEREQWFRTQLDLIGELMGLFHRDDVDVVVLNEATPLLAHQVVRHGRMLYEATPGMQADYEFTVLRRYVDTEPLRKLQDRRLLERAEEYRRSLATTSFRW